mmetsp:Transcript_85458/g.178549  ORF Transcript_85458/g.178549 Transcript_85458/m.178549 type:complete len:207 (-) Transcript_85458:3077-3697(-)
MPMNLSLPSINRSSKKLCLAPLALMRSVKEYGSLLAAVGEKSSGWAKLPLPKFGSSFVTDANQSRSWFNISLMYTASSTRAFATDLKKSKCSPKLESQVMRRACASSLACFTAILMVQTARSLQNFSSNPDICACIFLQAWILATLYDGIELNAVSQSSMSLPIIPPDFPQTAPLPLATPQSSPHFLRALHSPFAVFSRYSETIAS